MNFAKIKIRGTISNDLDLDKYYPDHDPEQYSKIFSRSDTLSNANADGAITFKLYNS